MSEIEVSYPSSDVPPFTDAERIAIILAMSDTSWLPQYIGTDNKTEGFAGSVEEAVRSQRPIMVKARADILVIDDDSGLERAVQFADEYLSDLDPVVCWSGQAHRQHLLVVIDRPDHRAYYAAKASEFALKDIQVGRWIRPPGAPHRLGGFSRPVGNVTAGEIERSLHRDARLTRTLGHKARTALYVGKEAFRSADKPDGDASAALRSATLGLVNAGYTEDQLWQLLMDHPGGEKLRSKMDEFHGQLDKTRRWWVKYYVEPSRRKVALRPAVSSPAQALAVARGARSWMQAHHWPGAGGKNNHDVLTVFLDHAERLGRVHDIGISVRELAEQAGLTSIGTATRAVQRLVTLGILQRVAAADSARDPHYHGPRASRYSITLPPSLSETEQAAWQNGMQDAARDSLLEQSESGGARLTVPVVTAPGLMAHDAFRHGAVTKSKLAVWECLDAESPMTTRQVADQLKYKTTGTPNKHLNDLATVGLALRTPHGWLRLYRDLDDVASEFGTTGKGEAQRQAHKAQRASNNKKFAAANVVDFIAQHIRPSGRMGGVIDHHELRNEYRAYCYFRKLHPTPVRDNVLIAAIQERYPKAVLHRHGTDRLLVAGSWEGVKVVGCPSADRRTEIERQLAETGSVWSKPLSRPSP